MKHLFNLGIFGIKSDSRRPLKLVHTLLMKPSNMDHQADLMDILRAAMLEWGFAQAFASTFAQIE